ncbi:MAG: nitroreductase family protein [Deltaproteobacteria bacterium]|nr:nitroreductase family protein [Deltaproteobacteria bacterium]
MELQEAIFKRRSVRRFTEDAVTDEELKKIFESVRWSPSWANTQTWEFIVVRDKELIEKVTGTYSDKNPATKCSLSASALIVLCAKTGVSGCYDGKEATPLSNWYMFDLGIAAQTLCLQAHEMGLGTVVVGLMNQDACKKLVAAPEGYEVVAVIPIGRPAVAAKEGPQRKEVPDFVYLNQFGKKMFE